MACMQCEQTENGHGCFTMGVCGKDPTTAAGQDALVHQLKGIGYWASTVRDLGGEVPEEVNEFTIKAAFSTLTNVNFDADAIAAFSKRAEGYRASLEATAASLGADVSAAPAAATWSPSGFDAATLATAAHVVGLESRQAETGADADEGAKDVFAAQEMAMYGIKGAAAYACHAYEAGKSSPEVFARLHKVLATLAHGSTAEGADLGSSLGLALEVGAINVDVMALLDEGHTTRFGTPGPTVVRHAPVEGKAILVSGHDLVDLEALLEQTAGKGINVYTHGEMLPAHGYPELNKHKHLAGHFGGPWNLQQMEWRSFPGPVIVTTNCLMRPARSYKKHLYTTNEVGWPDVQHIQGRDFSHVIDQALEMEGYGPQPEGDVKTSITGFGHSAVLGAAPTLLQAVKDGGLKKLVLIGGCDGYEAERSWFTDFAKALPDEAAILTLGCGKFRVLHKLGEKEGATIPGTEIPRVIDMGQCNDSYSAVVVAQELAKALDCGVNDLPLSINLSWLEQKAVAVLLSLLHLGVKGIRVGPSPPAFVTPNIFEALQSGFDLKLVTDHSTGAADAEELMRA